ncbi:AMP-binding protein [uncultured Desulfobacter sp.]|uniref:AMP-binding enzyme n=1 Tax=uncultured Desulfobacter sp. TaxID=240139 RepID=UPI0029F56866|nr:AMP-binding protein [uncultured Desulfobacter sp.]
MAMTDMSPQAAIDLWLKEYDGKAVSAAHFLCDRHARTPEKIALFYEDAEGNASKWPFRELKELSSNMAVFLRSIGVKKGDRVAVIDENGNETAPGEEGLFAVDTENSPLCWFRGYWQDEKGTKEKYVGENGRYCLAGDTVSKDEDGYLFFSGRSDDIILCAGYRIGPFEVESVLIKHPAVVEAAVVGVPDELRGETIKAFVSLKQGINGDEDLAEELKIFVKKHLAAHQHPRIIEFTDQLPKTPSGKIQRFLLRNA